MGREHASVKESDTSQLDGFSSRADMSALFNPSAGAGWLSGATARETPAALESLSTAILQNQLQLADGLHEAASALTQVFDLLPQAIVVVRHDQQILYRNAAANSLMQRTSRLSVNSIGLAFSPDATCNSRLWAVVLAALTPSPTDEAEVNLISIARGAGHPLTAIVRRLELEPAGLHASCALVMVTDLMGQVERASAAAARRYGFTRAEAQLVEAIALGTCIRDYAHQRDISPNTVKTQLKHVLAKTGLHRQAELVGLILGIPVTLF
jgi:DNA-binding CsgD family transcriptional regulator